MKKLKVSILLDERTMKTVLSEKDLQRLKKLAKIRYRLLKQISESDACMLI